MPPRKEPRTRTTPATATATTPITDAAIRALISRGVADTLVEQEIQRNNNLNGDGSQGSRSGIGRPVRPTRECTYSDFLKCQPLNFKGTEGVVGLTQWTVGHDAAYSMPWKTLMKMMIDKYCPRNEIKKLKIEIWDLKLMDKKIRTLTERQAENKRNFNNNNQAQQQLPKRQNVAQAYAAGTSERKEYARTLPLFKKCKFHHNGPCTAKCANWKKIAHLTRDCWNPTATSNQRIITYYECGNQGHYKSDCPELKNQNHGNQAEGTEARGMVYALGGGETDQHPNNIEDEIEA
ncbi:putative reverse transcriptase domain-containing protein [Tanacetum coccineum]